MRYLLLSAVCFSASFTTLAQSNTHIEKPQYPTTKTVEQEDNYHGTVVKDPYRWLEQEGTPEVTDWIDAQNKATFGYLEQIPFRKQMADRLTELVNYPKMTTPGRAGDYYFYGRNNGLQNQYVVYYKKGIDGEEKVFFDPNTLSTDGTVTLSIAGFSNDKKYVTLSQSKAGSDWTELYVREVATNKQLDDKIEWTKFGGAAWYEDGFFYSRFAQPNENQTFTAASENQEVYYHKLGTPQSADKLVYSDPSNPKRYFFAGTTDDERYLFVYQSEGTSGTGILWKDLKNPNQQLQVLFEGFDWEYSILDNENDKLIVLTNYMAPNYKVVLVDPLRPQPENWKELIPESKNLLEGVSMAGGKMFAFYLKDVTTRVYQHDRNGKLEWEINLPGPGTAGGFSGEKTDKVVYYSYTSFTAPSDIYSYDIETGKSALFERSKLAFDANLYETKQVFYPSKDGTMIPMFLTYKKGIKLDGSNPCLLYAYGGFNIAIKPGFSTGRIALLEQGFIYAVANLRGGSEYGEEWHKAGMLEQKQNVFDDFIAAAEFLIKEGYTSSSKLAIQGRSNGGLLVGAVMTQRPELFGVALPGVGVLDMLRYHKFTVGWGWAVEYGSSENAEQFDYIYKYSPLHNIRKGVQYPATLVTTADHDDRVVPAHSFKFAAAIQAADAGKNPLLIRIDTDAGHGAGKPLSKSIEEDADWMSFTMWNLGIRSYKEPGTEK